MACTIQGPQAPKTTVYTSEAGPEHRVAQVGEANPLAYAKALPSHAVKCTLDGVQIDTCPPYLLSPQRLINNTFGHVGYATLCLTIIDMAVYQRDSDNIVR